MLLPYVLEAYGSAIDRKAKDIAIAMGIADAQTPPDQARKALIARIRQMNQDMNIPEKLPNLCPEDFPALARNAHREANPLYPVPVLMDAKQLEQFYFDVLEEPHEVHTN